MLQKSSFLAAISVKQKRGMQTSLGPPSVSSVLAREAPGVSLLLPRQPAMQERKEPAAKAYQKKAMDGLQRQHNTSCAEISNTEMMEVAVVMVMVPTP